MIAAGLHLKKINVTVFNGVPLWRLSIAAGLEFLAVTKPCVLSLGSHLEQQRFLSRERHFSELVPGAHVTRFLHAWLTKSAV